MIIFIIVAILLLGIYVVIAPKNAVVWYFALYISGLMIVLISVAFYIFRLNTYPYLNWYDYTLYLYLQRFKPSFSEGRLLLVGGVAFLLLTNVYGMFLFSAQTKKNRFFILLLPVVIYFVLNHPEINEIFHIMCYRSENPLVTSILSQINGWTHRYNWLLIGVYHILPIAAIIRNCCITRIIHTRRSLGITLFCVVLLYTNMIYLGCSSMNQFFNLDFWGFPVSPKQVTIEGYFFMLCLFVITLIFGLLSYFKLFQYFNVFSKKTSLNARVSRKDLRMFFHMQKNLFLAMSKYSNVSEELLQTNPTDVLDRMNIIHKISDDALNNLSRSLTMLKAATSRKMEHSVYDLIDSALTQINCPAEITIDKEYPERELTCLADAAAITECFVNVINNAIEAIESGMKENGHVQIRVDCEPQLICVEITDNGCGIAKKEKKHIFDPLYSSKTSSKNYGLGMSYVRDVLIVHNGHVDIDSVQGEYTTIQVILPRYKERRLHRWKR